jgi:hypothetical protein
VHLSYTSSGTGNTSGTLAVTSGGTVVADINFIGSYATSNFQIASGPGGRVKITDPATSLQAGFSAGATFDYSGNANEIGGISSTVTGEGANGALFKQYMASQLAYAPGNNEAARTEPSVSGSTALLAQAHG